jgi:hypothetical protein
MSSFLGLCLFAALALNGLLALSLAASVRSAPSAFGQTSSAGGTMVLGTEKAPDQAPVCFVLSADPPHLLVYRVDNAGQLYLTASRDIHCDLQLKDRHLPFSGGPASPTRPPVPAVCKAVGDSGKEDARKADSSKEEDGKGGEVEGPEKEAKKK